MSAAHATALELIDFKLSKFKWSEPTVCISLPSRLYQGFEINGHFASKNRKIVSRELFSKFFSIGSARKRFEGGGRC